MIIVSLIISIISVLVVITNFVLNVKDRGKKEGEENNQGLLKYQVEELKTELRDIASDVKDVKKMLYSSKETTREMIKDAIDEHVKLYHTKEQ